MNKFPISNFQFPKLSVIIIAKDEEEMIEKCLESISWADEVILVDTGSQDKTIKIAKEIIPSIKVFKLKKGSFSDWRNKGLEKATGGWIFYLDADERVSEVLGREIKKAVKDGEYDYFAMPRLNNLLGKDMYHGGWYPDYVTRLFKKGKIKGWQGIIHESPRVEGRKGKLQHDLYHITHRRIETMVLKSLKWARLEAEQFHQKGKTQVSYKHLLSAPLKEFLMRVFWWRGFQDGIEGWLEGGMQAFNKFLVFAYLWKIQRKK